MALYTRTGDGGETECGDGRRVSKSDPRVAALGEIDELNAQVGLCLSACSASEHGEVAEMLRPVQGELCAVSAGLGPGGAAEANETGVARMEGQIDSICKKLGPLKQLVLPGGCEAACRLHVARAVCRRAERAAVACAEGGGAVPAGVLRYLNRLSDLLFALARLANRGAKGAEQTWPGAK